jgi:hypothetical protein
MELQKRFCACGCGSSFSVMPSSKQKFAGLEHEQKRESYEYKQLQLLHVNVLSKDEPIRCRRRSKYNGWAVCLRCGKAKRGKIGLCKNCKRHVDYKDADEDYALVG